MGHGSLPTCAGYRAVLRMPERVYVCLVLGLFVCGR